MQVLHIGQGRYLRVDHSFADAGEPARYGMVGGRTVLLNDGSRQKPEIFMCDGGFFYKNGQPVENVDDIEYLPQPYRKLAIEFVNKDKKPAAPVAETKEAAAAPKRGRGRPKKSAVQTKAKVVIKDENSLLEVAGYKD